MARLLLAILLLATWPARAGEDYSEYRLKAAYLYNFITFTEWPGPQGATLSLCILGADPFGPELDRYRGRSVGKQALAVRYSKSAQELDGCQVVFLSRPVLGNLARVFDQLTDRAVLTVADTPDAVDRGVMLNLTREGNKIMFEANLGAAREAGLHLSSKVLRLAARVVR
jgi:hypothetical protein